MVNKGQILIIEDNHDMRVCLRQELESAGFQVYSTASGTEALTLLENGLSPHLVLLDLNMPTMTGEEFLIRKNQKENLKDLPVIIVSGRKPNKPFIEEDAIFSKPVEWNRLILSISKRIRPARLNQFSSFT